MKKNLAKKNWTLRIGAAALMLAMVTTIAVGGTFAKYVHSMTGSDVARVAKFDYTSSLRNAEGEQMFSLFSTRYGATVESAKDDEKVVAPGTEGSFDLILTKNASEVTTEFVVDCKLDSLGFTAEGEAYFPIMFGVAVDGSPTSRLEAIDPENPEALNDLINDALLRMNLTPGPADGFIFPDGKDSIKITINWEWPFGEPILHGGNDSKDTELGEQDFAALAEATVTAKVTFTQID